MCTHDNAAMHNKPPLSFKAFMFLWLGLLTAMLIITTYLSIKQRNDFKKKLPMRGIAFTRNSEGLVTVCDSTEVICTFYDKYKNIGYVGCPDTILIIDNKDTMLMSELSQQQRARLDIK